MEPDNGRQAADVIELTVNQYDQMIEAGIFTKNDRVELIRQRGDCAENAQQSTSFWDHQSTASIARPADPESRHPRRSEPDCLKDSQPEPDVSVLPISPDDYFTQHPIPADVFVLIEVSDSSLDRDLDVKVPLYAENNVPEYWIVNLDNDMVIVHRGPKADGTWGTVTAHGRGDTLDIAALPGVTVAVADILP